MAEMSDYLENAVLNHSLGYSDIGTFVTQMYLSLHTGDPTDDDGVEVSGGSYVRKAISFAQATGTSGSVASTDAQSFTGMPAVTVTHIAIHDASSTGNMMYHTAVDTSKAVLAGDTISVAIGAVTVTLA